LSVRELLEFLLDDKAKRRLSLMSKTNHELFTMYYNRLKVKLTQDQLIQYQRLLDLFHRFLGEFPPSAELATEFLAQYANRSKATMVRYVGIIKGFMDWYGESLDIRVPKPKLLPQYVEPADIEKLADVIENKSTHKDTIVRDILLLRFATLTGLRRSELANLKVQDINLRQKMVLVRKGKGEKDRVVPLVRLLVSKIADFVKGKKPEDSVFMLTARSITDKYSSWSKKANLHLHTHSFRHYFAEQLLERGVPLTVVSKLLGHENVQTTSRYLGLRPGSLREAIDVLDEPALGEVKEESIHTPAEEELKPTKGGEDSGSQERLTDAVERLSKAVEKIATENDPGAGIQPIVYPKSKERSEKPD
jgi:integrase